MKFDVEDHLATVERSVSSLERDGLPARAVTLSRVYESANEDLWDALTNAERIPRWFLPVSGNLVPGGRYQLEGNAGGLIMACDRLSHFALTWEFGEDVSWVEVRFLADGDSHTRLTLTHTALLSEHWDTYGPGAVGVGWELGSHGTGDPHRAAEQTQARRSSFCHFSRRQGLHHRQQRKMGQRVGRSRNGPQRRRSEAAQRTTAFYTGESI